VPFCCTGVDKTIKSCAKYPDGITTPEAACNYIRDKEFCGDDPKYYCRYCDTDLCNNEPEWRRWWMDE
jgi:hypothetical protein